LELATLILIRIGQAPVLFDAFSSREPVPTSLENATDKQRGEAPGQPLIDASSHCL